MPLLLDLSVCVCVYVCVFSRIVESFIWSQGEQVAVVYLCSGSAICMAVSVNVRGKGWKEKVL